MHVAQLLPILCTSGSSISSVYFVRILYVSIHATRPSYPFPPGLVTQIIFSEAPHCVSLWISKQHFVVHVYVAAVQFTKPGFLL